MADLIKYRVYCETDSKYEYWWLDENASAPTTCPTNTAHTITTGSATIIERYEEAVQKVEDVIVSSTHDTRHIGKIATLTKTTTTDVDIALPSDMNHLQGGRLEFKNHVWGDYYSIQTIDIDNVLGYGANFVLATPFKDIPVRVDGIHDFLSQFMSKELPNGLYSRLKYTSIGTTNNVDVGWVIYGRKKP